jgi:hypothetical protein
MTDPKRYRLEERVEQILVDAYQRGGGMSEEDHRELSADERTEELAGVVVQVLGTPLAYRFAIGEAGALLAQAILDRNKAQGELALRDLAQRITDGCAVPEVDA